MRHADVSIASSFFKPTVVPFFVNICHGENALRANLVRRAEQWRWSSVAHWLYGLAADKALLAHYRCDWFQPFRIVRRLGPNRPVPPALN
jgi:hypothetical protein